MSFARIEKVRRPEKERAGVMGLGEENEKKEEFERTLRAVGLDNQQNPGLLKGNMEKKVQLQTKGEDGDEMITS